MSLVGIVNVDDSVSLVGSLQVVRLHRTSIMLVVGSVANKTPAPVDPRVAISGEHRGAGYSLSSPVMILLT
jgi:hypothetical protein